MTHLAYISGPISGMPNLNRHKFKAAQELLEEQGFIARNPHNFPNNHDGSWESYMKVCIPILTYCNSVYVLEGWENSRGALREVYDAEMLGIPVYSIETLAPIKMSFWLKLKMILNLV